MLQIYALLLVSISMFLRKFEFSSLEESNFQIDAFSMVGEYIVDALHLKVLGKSVRDKDRGTSSQLFFSKFCLQFSTHQPLPNQTYQFAPGLAERYNSFRYLNLWSNEQAPDLDPIRHLFCYLYIIGWKGGSLFPSHEEIKNPPRDGVYKTKLSESELYSVLNDIYHHVLQREEKLGTHAGRKTSYLFAFLAGITNVSEMMAAAFHKCPKVALKYILDAMSVKEKIRSQGDANQHVGQWHNCHSIGGENNRTVVLPGAKWQKPLPDLVRGFVEVVLRLSPLDKRTKQPSYLIHQALQWRRPHQLPMKRLQASAPFQKHHPPSFCHSHISSPLIQLQDELSHITRDNKEVIMNCVHTLVQDAYREGHQEAKAAADRNFLHHEAYIRNLKQLLQDEHQIAESDISSLSDRALQNAGLSYPFVYPQRSLDGDLNTPPAKKPRKTKDRGSKTLPAFNMTRKSWREKLQWILENSTGLVPSDYVEASRKKVERNQRIERCFRLCCQSNYDQFIIKHSYKLKGGKIKADFHYSQFKCEGCKDKR